QGCAGWYLGVDDSELRQRANRALEGKLPLTELRLPTAHANVSLVPADFSLRRLDAQLEVQEAGRNHLRNLLKPLAGDTDLAIFDCAPALSRSAELVFNAVDVLLVPLIPSPLSLRAYDQLKGFVAQKKWSELRL